jgi:hypothetical protein
MSFIWSCLKFIKYLTNHYQKRRFRFNFRLIFLNIFIWLMNWTEFLENGKSKCYVRFEKRHFLGICEKDFSYIEIRLSIILCSVLQFKYSICSKCIYIHIFTLILSWNNFFIQKCKKMNHEYNSYMTLDFRNDQSMKK